jgi:hypothetical protein
MQMDLLIACVKRRGGRFSAFGWKGRMSSSHANEA